MMKKSIGLFFSIILGFVFLSACQNSVKQSSSGLKKIDFILDWTPNTNHTGLYVAKEKGYFKDAGLDVDIKLPPEDSSSDLIINGKAPFGIYFQDSMAKKLVPNSDSNSITPIENKVFDAAWIYHGWDGILAEQKGMKTNFFYMKDFVPAFDYYSPVIIANNDYLKSHKEEAKKFIQAVKKGYQYAIEHPEEAADILIKQAPALANQRDFVLASQKYLSSQYASDKDKWGQFDPKRWNAFYAWAKEQGLVSNDLEDKGFTNELVGD